MKLWEQQAHSIQQALADTTLVELDELLIPRDHNNLLVRKMKPEPGVIPRKSAVLILLYPQDDELWFPLTARSTRLPQHWGEVSLPGGAADAEDDGPIGTALRETHEELGIPPEAIEIWGHLTKIYIPPSNFHLKPIVGFTPDSPHFKPNEFEIAEAFSVPLRTLIDPATVVVEEWKIRGLPTCVPFFALNGYKVWGATALVLSELVAKIKRVMAGGT